MGGGQVSVQVYSASVRPVLAILSSGTALLRWLAAQWRGLTGGDAGTELIQSFIAVLFCDWSACLELIYHMISVWYNFDFRVMSTLIGWLVTSLAFLASVEAYFVTVDAHAEECFFDKVTYHI